MTSREQMIKATKVRIKKINANENDEDTIGVIGWSDPNSNPMQDIIDYVHSAHSLDVIEMSMAIEEATRRIAFTMFGDNKEIMQVLFGRPLVTQDIDHTDFALAEVNAVLGIGQSTPKMMTSGSMYDMTPTYHAQCFTSAHPHVSAEDVMTDTCFQCGMPIKFYPFHWDDPHGNGEWRDPNLRGQCLHTIETLTSSEWHVPGPRTDWSS